MWAALSWDVVADQPPRVRNAMFLHESFHIAQARLGLAVETESAEHLDSPDGRSWLRLEWHARGGARRALLLARADLQLQGSAKVTLTTLTTSTGWPFRSVGW